MGASPPDVKSIFGQAMALSSPGERAAFLDEACRGDPRLRADVEALLQAHQDAGSFLRDRITSPAVTVDELPSGEGPGTVIGSYKLLEQIGEGGFGVVFMAEQTQPVRRKVALKVLKPGMDTRQVVARFEAERQALALMDHPNIAKVLDGGQTASGRPYFVMELVKGTPVTEFCDQNCLTPWQRLELFVHLCQAVQHAHQKGVIHRDLKPSNVLVSVHDTTPVVKVIDFGVAKALGQELTDKTLFTGFAQMIGTPLYMSPEQAGMSGLDVDTRSDIYSLGVLLYELLTGTTPFDRERLKELGYDELRRIIREEEPPRPSTRISTMGQAASTVSTQRRSDPKRLSQLFRGELDWIVMKALEKDRGRRYETASAFAADVQRYLADEAVLACPPSAWYRFRKLARRKKGAVATALAAALMVLLAVIGMAVSNVLIGRERDEKEEALNQVRGEKEKADRNLTRADRNLTRAETNFQAALAAVDDMLKVFSSDEDIKKWYQGPRGQDRFVERTPEENLRGELRLKAIQAQLRKARQIFQGFVDKSAANPETRPERAWAYVRLGRIWRKLGERAASVEDRRQAFREAVEAHRQAIRLFEQLVAESPQAANLRRELADTYSALAELLRALANKAAEVRQARSTAITLYERLVAEYPDDLRYTLALAGQYQELAAESAEAQKKAEAYRQVLAIHGKLAQDFPRNREYRLNLVKACRTAAGFHRVGAQRVTDEGFFLQAIQFQQNVVADFNVPQDILNLAGDCQYLAGYLHSRGRAGEAEQWYRQALALYDRLPPHTIPYGPPFLHGLANVCNKLGHVLKRAGRSKEAEQVFRRSVDFYEKLPAKDREIDTLNFPVGYGPMQKGESNAEGALYDYRSLGELFRDACRFQEAAQAYRKVLAIEEKLAVIDEKRFYGTPGQRFDPPWYRSRVAQTHSYLADMLRASGQPQQAEQVYRKAVELNQKLADEYPRKQFEARYRLAKTWTELVKLHKDSRQPDKAKHAGKQALEAYRRAVDLTLQPEWGLDGGSTARRCGAALGLAVPGPGGPGFLQAAVALQIAALGSDDPWRHLFPSQRVELANLGNDLGHQLRGLGKDTEAVEAWRKDVLIGEKAIAEIPTEQNRSWLAGCYSVLGDTCARLGRLDEAIASYRRAIEIHPKFALASRLADVCNNRAWPLATDPEPKRRNARQAVAFAQFAVKAAPANGRYWNTLGVSHYRAGSWKEAVAALKKSMELRQGGDSFEWFFLALAHWQLGDKALARKWYAPAVLWMDKYAPGNADLRRFRAEAAALLSVTAKNPQRLSGDGDLEIWRLVLEAQPDSVVARCQRADALAARGEWTRAATDYARAFEVQGPANPFHWFQHALIRLQLGDVKGYRQICSRMWERFGSSKGVDYFVLAHACALAPGALGDGGRVRQLAKQRLALTPPPSGHHVWSVHVLGLAYYRAGQEAKAVACLEKGLKDNAGWDGNVLNWLVLAMAEKRLGHAARAKEYLGKANDWIAQKVKATPKASSRFAPPDWAWRDWLMVQLFRREAGALIEGRKDEK